MCMSINSGINVGCLIQLLHLTQFSTAGKEFPINSCQFIQRAVLLLFVPDCLVSIVSYGLDDPGFDSQQTQNISVFSKTSRPALGARSLFNWYRGSFHGLQRPTHAADLPTQSIAEVKNGWCYTFFLPVCLQDACKDLTLLFTFSCHTEVIKTHIDLKHLSSYLSA